MVQRMVTVSKFLSKHLRHTPEALGLTLQPGGWVAVDDLLAASERAGFTISYDELIECVETNNKRRFSFDDSGDLIRANQGHSVEVELHLEESMPPDVLYQYPSAEHTAFGPGRVALVGLVTGGRAVSSGGEARGPGPRRVGHPQPGRSGHRAGKRTGPGSGAGMSR